MANQYKSVYKSEKARNELLSIYDKILQKWPVPFEEIYLDSLFGKTHIIRCGNKTGKPILLFHGTGNNSLMWRYNCEGLGKYFDLYLIDTINDPGKSEASLSFNPKKDYAKWVKSIVSDLNLMQFSMIGHSKGGWIALNTVLSIPQNVEKLILLAPAVGINAKLDPMFLIKSFGVGMNPTFKNVKKYFEYISSPGKELNMQYIEYISKVIKGTVSKPISHRQFTDAELKSVQTPTLLLFGDYEKCTDFHKVIERANSLFPHIESQIIPNTGHGLQGENPLVINELITNFINKNILSDSDKREWTNTTLT